MIGKAADWSAAGELAADLDPAHLALAMFALSAAPVTFPQIARALGLDPDAPTFADQYADQLVRLVTRLAE